MAMVNGVKQVIMRWRQVCSLICAMVLLSSGLASAEDYKAVSRRLTKAVLEGELSLEQAGAMMRTLREMAEDEDRGDEWGDDDKDDDGDGDDDDDDDKDDEDDDKGKNDERKAHLERVGKRLKAAVASGKMSVAEARAKWHQIANEDDDDDDDDDGDAEKEARKEKKGRHQRSHHQRGKAKGCQKKQGRDGGRDRD